MCLIPYLKVYHGSKKCLGSFFANGLLCWERGNALNPLRVNLFLMLVFIGPKSLPFNAFSLKSLQISLVWFSRNRLKMANPFCLLVKRPSAVMSEEKRLPFAGYRWIDYLVFELFTTLSPFNSCFGGYVSRSRLASSTCSNEKRIANSSSSEREARRTLTPFIFSLACGCPCHAGQKFQRLQSPFIRSSEKIVRKLEKPTLKSL